jgi:DHA2 family multidrug resistance protein-like MFS transporter
MTTDQTPSAGRRAWIGLAVLALPTLLLALDVSVLFLALPHLAADLHASSTQQLWIMDIYGFMIAGFLVTMGTLGDRIGRRKLLLTGAAAFGVASVAAAWSTSAEMLIAARALLGIAGATLAPSTLALISTLFQNPRQRGVAIAVWFSCFMGGSALGPVVGGVLLETFWWGSVFLLGVPVMVLLLATGPVLLPEYRDPNAGRLDPASVALSLATILPVVYGLKELAKGGLQTLPILAIVTGAVLGVVFVRRQRRLSSPLLDVRLFGIRSFSAALAIMLVGGVIIGGTFLFVAQYLQMVAGLTPLRAGLWQVPSALAMIAGIMLAPAIARRVRPAFVMAAGLAIAAAGFLVVAQVDSSGGLAVLVVGLVIAFFGNGLPGGLGVDLIVGSAPPEQAGSASSMNETTAELGIALGVATLGSVGTAVYRTQLAGGMPAGVPADVAQTAREGIASAVAAAPRLPGQLGPELLDVAREAFTAGLNITAGLGALLCIVLAVLAAVTLRHVRPSGRAQPDQTTEATEADAAVSRPAATS